MRAILTDAGDLLLEADGWWTDGDLTFSQMDLSETDEMIEDVARDRPDLAARAETIMAFIG